MHSLFFCNEEMDFTFIAKSTAWSEEGLYLVILTKLHASLSFWSKVGQAKTHWYLHIKITPLSIMSFYFNQIISSHYSLIHGVLKLSLRGHGAKCKTIKVKISSELFSAWAFLGKLSNIFYLPLLLALLVGNRSHISKVSMPDWRLLFRVAQIHGFML